SWRHRSLCKEFEGSPGAMCSVPLRQTNGYRPSYGSSKTRHSVLPWEPPVMSSSTSGITGTNVCSHSPTCLVCPVTTETWPRRIWSQPSLVCPPNTFLDQTTTYDCLRHCNNNQAQRALAQRSRKHAPTQVGARGPCDLRECSVGPALESTIISAQVPEIVRS